MRVLVLGAVALLLAGCGEPPRSDDPIVVQYVESDVDAATEVAAVEGGLAGIVVDQAIRPLEGARVVVPGLERETKTDKTGRFALTSLPEGGLFLRVEHRDHLPATAEVVIRKGDVVEIRVVLQAYERDPYVVVEERHGYTELSGTIFGGLWPCSACTFQVNSEAGATAVVVEAASSRPDDPVGASQFYWSASDVTGRRIGSGFGGDPLRIEWTDETPTSMSLTIQPEDTVPQTDVAFDVFIAVFYNGADPEAWTVVGGGA